MKNTPSIGTRVTMTAPNSNWVHGETGTVIAVIEDGKVVIDFDGREDGDGYTAFVGDFDFVDQSASPELFTLKVTREIPGETICDFVRTRYGKVRKMTKAELDEEISLQNRRMYQWEKNERPILEIIPA